MMDIVRVIDGKPITITLTKEEAKAAHKLVVHEKLSDYIQEIAHGDWAINLSEEEKAAMRPKVIEKMDEILEDYIQTSGLRYDALCAACDYYDIDKEDTK